MATFNDSFTRADNTDLGANWDAGYTSRNALDLVSNAVRVPSNGTSMESVNSITPGNDQFCKLTVKTFNNVGFIYMGPCVRAAAPATLTVYQFLGFKNHGTGITTSLQKIVAGASTTLTSESLTTWAANDEMVLSVVGQVLVGWRNGAPFLTTTDSAIASGRIAATMRNDTGATSDAEIDDFFGGDLSTTTVRPSSDGTTTGWTKTGGSGTYASCIVDDPDSNDGDTSYVLSPNVADGQMWVLLDDMPADFDLGVRATLKASAKKINTPNMTVDLSDMYLAIQRSDESTGLAAESTVCNVTVTASYTLFSRDVVISGTNTKTDWDGARLRLRFDHTTQSTLDTTNQIRITAAEVIILYVPVATTISEAVGSAAGAATVAGDGQAIVKAAGEAAGIATVSGDGQAVNLAAGAAAGAATATGEGKFLLAGAGASAGATTVSGDGEAIAQAAGAAAGVAAVSGDGQAIVQAVGNAAGAATVEGVAGAAIVEAVGSAAGAATAAAIAKAFALGGGSSQSISTAAAIAQAINLAAGASAGVAVAEAVGSNAAGAGISDGDLVQVTHDSALECHVLHATAIGVRVVVSSAKQVKVTVDSGTPVKVTI